jgi:NDP-hexose-3-ketoreductase
MKILFIGYSNVLKMRIFPILDRLNFIDSVSIAKFEEQSWDDLYKSVSKPIELFDNYDDAICNSKASIAYITTTNNSHFKWAKATLIAGMHTIIDKPATISLHETEELLQIAKDKQLLLSESTVYMYHPQVNTLKNIIEQNNSTAKLLTVHFSFPPMNKNNFRYNKELGGGAFLDTSPYAVSIGRYFFDSVPEECHYIENEIMDEGLEVSYSLLLKYSNGRSLIGHFGFNTEYVNRLNILGDKICIDLDRIFTIPDFATNQIKVRSDNQSSEINSPHGNAFELYLTEIGNCLRSKAFNKLYNDMYMDAYSRELIINKKNKPQNGN